MRAGFAPDRVVAALLATVPEESTGWSALARDQYLEIRTLLSGYLLSSQGDRMLMASSIEGRFPYLEPRLVALACGLPDAYKIRALDEKHILKRAAADLLPKQVWRRPKQPYRAPDAAAFVGPDCPAWVAHVTSEASIARASGSRFRTISRACMPTRNMLGMSRAKRK